uniref:Uncharacterized protein n=1 Tax=Anguilla anguilla TaxID=7936 RepID=A0A0E9WKV8_ANGAN
MRAITGYLSCVLGYCFSKRCSSYFPFLCFK